MSYFRSLFALMLAVFASLPSFASEINFNDIRERASLHKGQTGVYVLEKGEESLLARAWLTTHARQSIDVQYFIWSTDNIGTLASENLLQAADRGVRVRIIVDDLLVDAEPKTLLALAAHPKVSIRIYNPVHSVGTGTFSRMLNIASDFRGANQRMHDKVALFDDMIAITGGRNMADEYYDYDHKYNFRDRDVLLLGEAATSAKGSFERFWKSSLSIPVEKLLTDEEPPGKQQLAQYYGWLKQYAADPGNYAPEVRQALHNLGERFPELLAGLDWCDVTFISDRPGKNPGDNGLEGGGQSTAALVSLVQKARTSVTIQTPYLVMPPGGIELFSGLVKRGVRVRVVTNSLASTDNLQAFSGYHKQRDALLATGVEIHEFRPYPAVQNSLIERYEKLRKTAPVFALHAKTMVIDGRQVFIGTFNLDPRSANLNTEVGALIYSPRIAAQVEASIEQDMRPENSWLASSGEADAQASLWKRIKLWFWELFPLDPIL